MNAQNLGDVTEGARRVASRARRRGAGVRVETLEGRELLSTLSPAVTLPSPITAGPMAVDSLGNLWLAQQGKPGVPTLAKVSYTGRLATVVLPAADTGGTVTSVKTDPAGNAWYVISIPDQNATTGKVGVINSSGVISEYPVTIGETPGSSTFAHSALWVAERGASGSLLASYSPNGTTTAFPVSVAKGPLTWLTTGPDGDVWFVDGSNVGKMSAGGDVTEYPVATSSGAAADLSNAQLTTGPDGNLWFLAPGAVDRITPAGVVSGLPTPTGNVTSLGVGNDGNLWIAFQPTNGSPLASTPGEVLARLSISGQTTAIGDRVLTGQSVTSMVSGTDSLLWINEGAGVIGQINLAGVPTVTPPMITPVSLGELATDAGKTVSGVVASFTPSDSSTTAANYNATIDWGDGTTSGANLIAGSQGNIDVTGVHQYATALTGSTEQATIAVAGPNGGIAKIFAVVQVANALGNVPYPSLIGSGASTSSVTTTTASSPASTTLTSTAVTPVSVDTTASHSRHAAAQAALASRRAARLQAHQAAIAARQGLHASKHHKA